MPRKPSFDRDELIDRAKDIFWKRGWAGTSLKDLEQALKLKPGSFYAAFGSKDNLYALALERYAQDGRDRIAKSASDHGPIAALKELPKAIVRSDDAPSKACMLAKTYLELHAHKHPLATNADNLLRDAESQFAELFYKAQKVGEIRMEHDPHALARRYQSDLLGMRVSAERGHGKPFEIAGAIANDLDKL